MTDAPSDPAIAFAGLILDLDGTLADTMPSHYIAWCKALEPFGLTYPESLFYQWGGKPDTRIAEDLAADQGVKIDVVKVAEAKRRAYLDLGPEHVKPLPRTLALAEACRGVVPMAIATGGRKNIALSILDTLALCDWFDAVVTA
ncbi:MAG: HAD family hydrolase, partial [Phycisphaeraceae bacterium]